MHENMKEKTWKLENNRMVVLLYDRLIHHVN